MCDRESIKMSAAAALYRKLEDREAARMRMPRPIIRERLARIIKATPGTLRNLASGRLERAEYLEDAIRNVFIRSLEAEIAALSHEVEMARMCSVRPDADEIFAAEAALAQAKRLIGK